MQELKLGMQAVERKKELAAGNAAAQNSFRYWHRATLQDASDSAHQDWRAWHYA